MCYITQNPALDVAGPHEVERQPVKRFMIKKMYGTGLWIVDMCFVKQRNAEEEETGAFSRIGWRGVIIIEILHFYV